MKELSVMMRYADMRMACRQESVRYNVVKWLIALTWTHHADISSNNSSEDSDKQGRKEAGWADRAEQTKAVTVSRICRSYLPNLFPTDGFMIIQLLCGCLNRGDTSKPPPPPPDYRFLSALHPTTAPTRETFAEYRTWSAEATEDCIGTGAGSSTWEAATISSSEAGPLHHAEAGPHHCVCTRWLSMPREETDPLTPPPPPPNPRELGG